MNSVKFYIDGNTEIFQAEMSYIPPIGSFFYHHSADFKRTKYEIIKIDLSASSFGKKNSLHYEVHLKIINDIVSKKE
jgi:hypothetical protein